MDVAAGEYAYVPADFRNPIGAVDCLQADATRCLGISATGPGGWRSPHKHALIANLFSHPGGPRPA
jgi:hypothetical protein